MPINLTPKKVLVCGDVMIDEYVYTQYKMVAQECSCPVMNCKDTKQYLGGAANVAASLIPFGIKADLFHCGGTKFHQLVVETGVKINHVDFIPYGSQITKKIRIINTQKDDQVIRIDQDVIVDQTESRVNDIVKRFTQVIESYDGVILSDYGKGFFTHDMFTKMIDICNSKNIPVFVDPKSNDWSMLTKATLIKSNRSEYDMVTTPKTMLSNVHSVVSYGRNPVCYVHKNLHKHIPFHSFDECWNIRSTVGAGDSMIASLMALYLNNNNTLDDNIIALSATIASSTLSEIKTCVVEKVNLISILNTFNQSSKIAP